MGRPRIIPHLRYFKTLNILILMYEKWKFSYPLGFDFID